MDTLYLVYGTWDGDGDDRGEGNILGVFRDLNTAEDTMIKTARESFDHYNTPAKYRFCDYYDAYSPCDRAGHSLYRIIAECDYTTDLCLLHYTQEETFGDRAYVVWGSEDLYNQSDFYPLGQKLFNSEAEAIGYASKLGSRLMHNNDTPYPNRFVKFSAPEDTLYDNCIFEIGDTGDLTTWIKVKEITIQ